MQTEGQSAENPQPEIIQRSVLSTGRFEDADEQQCNGSRQQALHKKLPDCIASCHGQDLLSTTIISVGEKQARTICEQCLLFQKFGLDLFVAGIALVHDAANVLAADRLALAAGNGC